MLKAGHNPAFHILAFTLYTLTLRRDKVASRLPKMLRETIVLHIGGADLVYHIYEVG